MQLFLIDVWTGRSGDRVLLAIFQFPSDFLDAQLDFDGGRRYRECPIPVLAPIRNAIEFRVDICPIHEGGRQQDPRIIMSRVLVCVPMKMMLQMGMVFLDQTLGMFTLCRARLMGRPPM